MVSKVCVPGSKHRECENEKTGECIRNVYENSDENGEKERKLQWKPT